MYSIAIISDMHDWHSNEIKFYLEKFGCKVAKVSFEETDLFARVGCVFVSVSVRLGATLCAHSAAWT